MYKRIRSGFSARMIFLKNANEKVVLFICLPGLLPPLSLVMKIKR